MTPPEEVQKNPVSVSAGIGGDVDNRKNTIEKYREKYRLLSIRYAILQQENEDLANQLTNTRSALRKGRKYRSMLLQKLDSAGDSWRNGKMPKDVSTEVKTCTSNTATANTSSLTNTAAATRGTQ